MVIFYYFDVEISGYGTRSIRLSKDSVRVSRYDIDTALLATFKRNTFLELFACST